MLLDENLEVTHTSDFYSKWTYAALEIGNHLLYTMNDANEKRSLALVEGSTLRLIYKHQLTMNEQGYCLCLLDDTHFILG